MSKGRKYAFDWDSTIGDMRIARETLGPTTRVEVYRLLQFTLRDILEQRYGTVEADDVLRASGRLAGTAFYQQFCTDAESVGELMKLLKELFKELGIGILRFEKSDLATFSFTLTMDEDLDCSGMQETDDVTCVYDEGFLQGIFQEFTGKAFNVKEVDCWSTGKRTCRFVANMIERSQSSGS